ncbi:hypothetical protein V6N13_110491 [Hibiscus sabdariffa]|uniref:Uncharacterized protein n=1 Tax=Hibiscus sabdariffa TaxID=183260 RepID=A0ABR2THD7_9ROSI
MLHPSSRYQDKLFQGVRNNLGPLHLNLKFEQSAPENYRPCLVDYDNRTPMQFHYFEKQLLYYPSSTDGQFCNMNDTKPETKLHKHCKLLL